MGGGGKLYLTKRCGIIKKLRYLILNMTARKPKKVRLANKRTALRAKLKKK